MTMASLIENNSFKPKFNNGHGIPNLNVPRSKYFNMNRVSLNEKKQSLKKFQTDYDVLRNFYFTSSMKLMVISSELLSDGFIPAFSICSKCSLEMPSNDDEGIEGVLGIPRSASRRP